MRAKPYLWYDIIEIYYVENEKGRKKEKMRAKMTLKGKHIGK